MKMHFIITGTLFLVFLKVGFTQNIPAYKAPYIALKAFRGDTSRYLLESFEERKDEYVGKKMELLLHDLELPVRSYTYISSWSRILRCKGSYLYFFDHNDESKRNYYFKDVTTLLVEWDAVAGDTIVAMARKDHSNWGDGERAFFGKLVVKNIKVLNFYEWQNVKACPNLADVYYFTLQRNFYNTERITYQLDDGTKYAISSYNPLLIDGFLLKYPNHGLLDPKTNDINLNTDIGKIYLDALSYFQSKDFDPDRAMEKGYTGYEIDKVGLNPKAQALAYILKKLDTGIVLLKVAKNGKYFSVYDNKWHAP